MRKIDRQKEKETTYQAPFHQQV